MSIWQHEDVDELNSIPAACQFCHASLRTLIEDREFWQHPKNPLIDSQLCTNVAVCDLCGWWAAHPSSYPRIAGDSAGATITGGQAVLRQLDFSSPITPCLDE